MKIRVWNFWQISCLDYISKAFRCFVADKDTSKIATLMHILRFFLSELKISFPHLRSLPVRAKLPLRMLRRILFVFPILLFTIVDNVAPSKGKCLELLGVIGPVPRLQLQWSRWTDSDHLWHSCWDQTIKRQKGNNQRLYNIIMMFLLLAHRVTVKLFSQPTRNLHLRLCKISSDVKYDQHNEHNDKNLNCAIKSHCSK